MSVSSPTQRTLKWLRDRGYLCGVVEKWNPHARIRQDLFGFADIVVIDYDGHATAYFQVTSGSNHAARRRKIEASENARRVAAKNGIFIQSWTKKPGAPGRQKWFERTEEVSFD